MLNKLKCGVAALLLANAVLFMSFLAYPRATELWQHSSVDAIATQLPPAAPAEPTAWHINATTLNRNLLSLAKTKGRGCKAPCLKILSPTAKNQYKSCVERVHGYGVDDVNDNGCRFISGDGREKVALASFPGSGNTWVRGILEQVTGVCTGATMCDMSLRAGGFSGEGVDSQSVLVVKTHRKNWREAGCSSAVIVIRNPLDALVSEFNRFVANNFSEKTVVLGTHTNRAGKEYFRENTIWKRFLLERVPKWKYFVLHWVIVGARDKHNMLVVRYEDLKERKLEEVERMLKFLKFPYQRDQLNATLSKEYGIYHRKPREQFAPFTPQQRKMVMTMLRRTQSALVRWGASHILELSAYLDDEYPT